MTPEQFIKAIAQTKLQTIAQKIAYARLVQGKSIKDVAKEFGVGRERVRQVVARVEREIRKERGK